VDLHAINDGGSATGVAHSAELITFAEAMVGADDEALGRARQKLVAVLGRDAMIDAAGVASNFERMVRIADGTGITLGDSLEQFSSSVRDELQLDRLRDRKLTPDT